MTTHATRSSRMFEPMIGSDALFLNPSEANNPTELFGGTSPPASDHHDATDGGRPPPSNPPPQSQPPCGGGPSGGETSPLEPVIGAVDNVLGTLTAAAGTCSPVGNVVGNLGDDVTQTIDSLGGGMPLQDVLTPLNTLLGGSDPVSGLVNDLGNPLGSNGLGNFVSNLGNTVLSDVGQILGGTGSGDSIDGLLNHVGQTASSLVNGVLSDVGCTTGSGPVRNILDGAGGDLLDGIVGGGGLLKGTPLDGLQGNGALVSTNLLRGDDSSPSSLVQVGTGTDPSKGLINVDVASNRGTSESNHLIDTDIGPKTSGNGLNLDLLGANRDSSGALVDADVGQHQGPSLVDINLGTAADQFHFPSLSGVGMDSLVGDVSQLLGGTSGPGSPCGPNPSPCTESAGPSSPADLGMAGILDGIDTHAIDTGHLVGNPLHGALA